MYETHELLKGYRKRSNKRNLHKFASNVLDLYLLIKPKLPKTKSKKEFKARFDGIDSYLICLDKITPQEAVKYFEAEIDAIEEIGITKITLPTSKLGAEMLEGTIISGLDYD